MYLSKFTDYSFRLLICLAKEKNYIFRTEDLSRELEISHNHLKKIVYDLAKNNLIVSIKGRRGGIRINREPKDINLGDVLKITEKNLNISECFYKENGCPYIRSDCKLKGIMNNALNEFINEFSKYTLEDLL